MKHLIVTEKAKAGLNKLPPAIAKKAKKQLLRLRDNLHHPSLHAKKYSEHHDVWQGRVDKSYRFFFTIEGDTYRIHAIGNHPK